jgi:transketolase N-terminal domain/subunit
MDSSRPPQGAVGAQQEPTHSTFPLSGGSLGPELVVGPDIALGQQVGDKHGSDAIAIADDDLEGGEVVEKDLTAPAARGNNSRSRSPTATIVSNS